MNRLQTALTTALIVCASIAYAQPPANSCPIPDQQPIHGAGHYINSAQHLEDVPGRAQGITNLVPMREFMSVEQYELTLPTRARHRGIVWPLQPKSHAPRPAISIQMQLPNGAIQYIELDTID